MSNTAKVLIYNIDADSPRGVKLANAVHICGASVQTIAARQCGQTIGYLLGLDGYEENPLSNAADEREAIVFYNFTEQMLHRLLGALKRAGVFIPLKAAVTKHNIGWELIKLLDELENEHNLMKAWQQLNACVKSYKGRDRDLIKAAKELLSAHSPDADAIDEMIKRFS